MKSRPMWPPEENAFGRKIVGKIVASLQINPPFIALLRWGRILLV